MAPANRRNKCLTVSLREVQRTTTDDQTNSGAPPAELARVQQALRVREVEYGRSEVGGESVRLACSIGGARWNQSASAWACSRSVDVSTCERFEVGVGRFFDRDQRRIGGFR